MKRNWVILCLSLIMSFTYGPATTEAVVKKQKRYIGLHDRQLPIEDVRIIDGNTKVPLTEIAKYLYITLDEEKGFVHFRKSGLEISFDRATGITTKSGTELNFAPIIEIDGTLYISVKYITEQLGFQMEYLPTIHTLRIYRDNHEHLSNADYENKFKTPTVVKKPANAPGNVYLTFDDGPNQFTILNTNTLNTYNVQGTFFFLGKHMKTNKEIVERVAADGHYIGSHSMTHDKNKVYKSSKTFIDEMNEGTELIKTMTGNDANLLRVPYGSKPHVTTAMRKQLNKNGYKMWDWDVDSKDWQYTDKQTAAIIKNVQTGVEKALKSGDRDIIVLLHDRSQTTKALPEIIQWLQKQGYTIKSYKPEQHITQNFHHDPTL